MPSNDAIEVPLNGYSVSRIALIVLFLLLAGCGPAAALKPPPKEGLTSPQAACIPGTVRRGGAQVGCIVELLDA